MMTGVEDASLRPILTRLLRGAGSAGKPVTAGSFPARPSRFSRCFLSALPQIQFP
jgi:hypothetical protein